MKKVDYSETIGACDLKQNEDMLVMKVKVLAQCHL